eukprot:TRINITY_DN5875_c0_g1_i1.p1 TRINITY_DN5875_c0_g1~~TRINITY_DN5875_c0_g1_i1.p1  ORF type:complete len:500 (-),score=230.96 TRINITY_DN5875_c0_g1_i1:600-2099(-)
MNQGEEQMEEGQEEQDEVEVVDVDVEDEDDEDGEEQDEQEQDEQDEDLEEYEAEEKEVDEEFEEEGRQLEEYDDPQAYFEAQKQRQEAKRAAEEEEEGEEDDDHQVTLEDRFEEMEEESNNEVHVRVSNSQEYDDANDDDYESVDENELDEAQIPEFLSKAQEEHERLLMSNYELQRKIVPILSSFKQDQGAKFREEGQKVGDTNETTYLKLLDNVDLERQELEREQQKSNNQQYELLSELHEQNKIAEDLKEEIDEKRKKVLMNSEFSRRIVKRNAVNEHGEKVVMQKRDLLDLLNRDRAKDEEVSDIRLKHIQMSSEKAALDAQLEKTEEMQSKGYHLIDFEQLKIDNQTQSERIEERNEEASKLNRKITSNVQVITHVKEKLQFVSTQNEELRAIKAQLDSEVKQHRKTLNRIKKERDSLRSQNQKIKQQSGLVGAEDLLEDYESRKGQIEDLKDKLAALKSRHNDLTARANKYSYKGVSTTSGAGIHRPQVYRRK